jgi:hypothetical protein
MKSSVYCAVVACALAISMQIQADQPGASQPEGFLTATAVSDDELDVYRGEGIDVQTINTAELNGNLEGNTAINSVTGDNVISNGAFADTSGLSTAIQNSGNNVLIQNSTIVNVVIEQPPLQ